MMLYEEKSQSIKNTPELTHQLEFVEKNIKTNIKYNSILYIQKVK